MFEIKILRETLEVVDLTTSRVLGPLEGFFVVPRFYNIKYDRKILVKTSIKLTDQIEPKL